MNYAIQQNWMYTGSRKQLAAWSEDMERDDPSGRYIVNKRVKKPCKKGWQVNLLYKPHQRGQALFNFHLKVPAKKSS